MLAFSYTLHVVPSGTKIQLITMVILYPGHGKHLKKKKINQFNVNDYQSFMSDFFLFTLAF